MKQNLRIASYSNLLLELSVASDMSLQFDFDSESEVPFVSMNRGSFV